MGWNQLRPFPSDRLTRIKGWEAKGLRYWQDRLAACEQRVRDADSGGALGRAVADKEVAECAVARLRAEG